MKVLLECITNSLLYLHILQASFATYLTNKYFNSYCLFYVTSYSEVFYDGHTKKEVDGRTIGGFCLFKKGIKPEWEDPCNNQGSELTCRNVRSLDYADVYWENLVLGIIGETIDDGDEICGCRIVNKTTSKLTMKIEVWLRSRNTDMVDKLKVRLLDAISEPGLPSRGLPDFVYKIH